MNKFLSFMIGAGITTSLLLSASCGKNPRGPGSDEEEIANHQGVRPEKNFAVLINRYQQAKASNTPWAGAWWAYKRNGNGYWGNGIAANVHGNATPAGKYDAARCMGSRTQDWEVKHHGQEVKDAEGWWGHCNGWSVAAALYPEPKEPVKVNGVTFDVADIKALMTESAMLSSIDFFGARMEKWHQMASREYGDVSPDVFFLVLTNFMGKLGQAVLLDQDTGPAVWNQPMVAYRFEYPKRTDYLGANDPNAPNVYKITMTSTIWWASDNVSDPGMITPEFRWQAIPQVFDERKMKMELWLDGPVEFDRAGKVVSSGNVVVARMDEKYHVGGDWKMQELIGQPGYDWEHLWPDYLWVPYQIQKAEGYPENDKEYFANPHVDHEWVRDHLMPPGGMDDLGFGGKPCPVPAVPPSPKPTPSASPSASPRP